MVSHISWSSSGVPALPNFLQIFLEDIMTHALENYNGTSSIGGRQITNLHFADDIDGITGEEAELTKLVHNLNTAVQSLAWTYVLKKPR